MLLSGDENAYSTGVENLLYMHPAILEEAAVGVSDEKWGEAVKGVADLDRLDAQPGTRTG
jgi:acyl-CoA synthetase (AMP-forming)/AMP-acid ligase II